MARVRVGAVSTVIVLKEVARTALRAKKVAVAHVKTHKTRCVNGAVRVPLYDVYTVKSCADKGGHWEVMVEGTKWVDDEAIEGSADAPNFGFAGAP